MLERALEFSRRVGQRRVEAPAGPFNALAYIVKPTETGRLRQGDWTPGAEIAPGEAGKSSAINRSWQKQSQNEAEPCAEKREEEKRDPKISPERSPEVIEK